MPDVCSCLIHKNRLILLSELTNTSAIYLWMTQHPPSEKEERKSPTAHNQLTLANPRVTKHSLSRLFHLNMLDVYVGSIMNQINLRTVRQGSQSAHYSHNCSCSK